MACILTCDILGVDALVANKLKKFCQIKLSGSKKAVWGAIACLGPGSSFASCIRYLLVLQLKLTTICIFNPAVCLLKNFQIFSITQDPRASGYTYVVNDVQTVAVNYAQSLELID